MGGFPDGNVYQEILRSRVAGAVASARAANDISHAGLKGEVLEILIAELFSPLLPSDVGVGTGQIIECRSGRLSNQVDIVLYDRSVLPPLLFGRQKGIFPVESVLYAIEVKTTLTRSGLQAAHDHARDLDGFEYVVDAAGPVERVRSVIFALSTDLAAGGTSEIDRYKGIYGGEPPYLRALCVVDRGYWYDDGQKWLCYKLPRAFDEVLAFLGGVTNSYKMVGRSRGDPKLGQYIIPAEQSSVALTATKPGEVLKVSITVSSDSKSDVGSSDEL